MNTTVNTWRPKSESAPGPLERLRQCRPAPELYPDLDFGRIRERAAELRAAPSDAAAIRMVLERHDDNTGD